MLRFFLGEVRFDEFIDAKSEGGFLGRQRIGRKSPRRHLQSMFGTCYGRGSPFGQQRYLSEGPTSPKIVRNVEDLDIA